MDENTQASTSKQPKPKSGKLDNKIMVIIALSIVAVGAIIFGVSELVTESSDKARISELQDEVDSLKKSKSVVVSNITNDNNTEYSDKTGDSKQDSTSSEKTSTSSEEYTKISVDEREKIVEPNYSPENYAFVYGRDKIFSFESNDEYDLMVRSLVEKYTSVDECGRNIFDQVGDRDTDLDATKVSIAFENLPSYSKSKGDFAYYVYVDDLIAKYREMFGKDKNLKGYYEIPKTGPSFELVTYRGSGTKYYEYTPSGAGCNGYYPITHYVGYKFDGGKLVVDMIHTEPKFIFNAQREITGYVITLIDGEEIDFPDNPNHTNKGAREQDAAAEDVLEKYHKRLQHYDMVFAKEDDHYILEQVIKK